MRFIADLHIHSKYARAVSPKMLLPELDRWADDKGILVMGTGDFTHPAWFLDISKQLEPAEPGLFKLKKELQLPTLKDTKAQTRFLLTVEISSIYSRAGKGHRVHTIIFAPDIATVAKINEKLNAIGNIKSDGRPILGLDVRELMKLVLDINPECVIVPAHIWTPWFSLFGSKSGFNSMEECFGDLTKHIFAIETGLSSDPVMNWRLSALDHIAIISNSDSHSLERIGREANIFDTELSYAGIIRALKNAAQGSVIASEAKQSRVDTLNEKRIPMDRRGVPRDDNNEKFVATIEYFPEEGMYHFDGHRKCGVSYAPDETRKRHGLCKSCGKPVTVGVLNRLDKLADRPEITPVHTKFEQVIAHSHEKRVPYINLVTLDSIIGEALDVGVKSKAVKQEYDKLIKTFDNELTLLMKVPFVELVKETKPEIAEGIRRMREHKMTIIPGFDGQYGVVKIFDKKDRKKIEARTLF